MLNEVASTEADGERRTGKRGSPARSEEGADDEGVAAATAAASPYGGYLTPLQQSLVYELTTRRSAIAREKQRADFWEARRDERGEATEQQQQQQTTTLRGGRTHFGDDVLDEDYYNERIAAQRALLARKKQARALKSAIVESADAAHAINASMAAVPPAPPKATRSGSLSLKAVQTGLRAQQPLRSLVAQRDDLALQFLQVEEQIQSVRQRQRRVLQDMKALREITSSTLKEIHALRKDSEQKKHAATSGTPTSARNRASQQRIAELQEALPVARGKREMVKGVLRGLILESGLDWVENDEIKKLVLALGDDAADSSDEEGGLMLDEAHGAQEEESDDGSEGESDM